MVDASAKQSLSDGRLRTDQCWLLQGSRVSKGSTSVNRSYPAFLDSVKVDDRVGTMVDASGTLTFYLNGKALGTAAPSLPVSGGKKLHLVLDPSPTHHSISYGPRTHTHSDIT